MKHSPNTGYQAPKQYCLWESLFPRLAESPDTVPKSPNHHAEKCHIEDLKATAMVPREGLEVIPMYLT